MVMTSPQNRIGTTAAAEQRILIVRLNGYVHLVPFVETDEHFFMKTIIPSRKENRLQKPSTPTETP